MSNVKKLGLRYQRVRYAADRWGAAYLARKAYPYLAFPLLGKVHPKPNLLILGAQKCGTSSFHDYLKRESCTASSIVKEIHYFDYHYRAKSVDWYRAHFPYIQNKARATLEYLADKRGPERVHKVLESPRFIVLLRNPVERAYSHYRMRVRNGWEDRSFSKAVQDQIANYHALGFSPENVDEGYWEPIWHDFDYVGKSLYERQIRHWLKTFDIDNFLFIESESLFEKPREIMQTVATFLGVDMVLKDSFPARNRHDSRTPAVPKDAQTMLWELLRPEMRGLPAVTGRKFRWLKEGW